MDDYLIDIPCKDQGNIRDVEDLQDQRTMFQFKGQVDSQEGKHDKKGDQGREQKYAFQYLSLQKCDQAALQSASRAFESTGLLECTGSKV